VSPFFFLKSVCADVTKKSFAELNL